MPGALTEYLLFLAKAVTLVVAIVAVVVLLGVAARRNRPRSRLQVRDLGERLDRTAWALRAAVLPAPVYKSEYKQWKQRRKALKAESHPARRRPRIYVLTFRGDIRATRTAALREEISAVLAVAEATDEVVVRLENPGGTVNDQGLAASQLRRVRDRGIPLTVTVDTVAASGGYMMACVADRIVAAPFAVVGSIGVVTQVPNLHRLLERAGVDVEQFTGGEFKRTVTVLGRNTDEDRRKLDEQIQDTHALFKEFVAQNRPQVDIARVATGEYWYGARALELNLVYELRTSDDLLLAARERADLYDVSWTPPRTVRGRLAPFASALAR